MDAIGSITAVPDSYAEAAGRFLDPAQCALLVIDIQEKLLPPIFEKERLIKNSQLLIRLAGILGLHTLLTTQHAKGLGQTVPAIAELLPQTQVFDKVVFS